MDTLLEPKISEFYTVRFSKKIFHPVSKNKWYARNDVDYSFDFKGLYLVLKLLTLNNVYDRNGKLTRFQSLLSLSFWHANLQTEL